MSENTSAKQWLMRVVFTAMTLLIMYWQLLPLNLIPNGFTGPDLLLVVCIVWVLRRPDLAPILLVAAIMLLADFLFLRPPGLFAAVTVLVCENLRRRSLQNPDMILSLEWLTAAGGMAAIVLGTRLLSTIFVIDQPSLGLQLIQLIQSILVYPLVAGFCVLFLGLRRMNPHERELS